jgi:hypothetical protein
VHSVACVNRFTFLVQVHPEGISTLENLSTHERVPIPDLNAIGPQIERWLHEEPDARRRPPAGSEPVRRESARGSAP